MEKIKVLSHLKNTFNKNTDKVRKHNSYIFPTVFFLTLKDQQEWIATSFDERSPASKKGSDFGQGGYEISTDRIALLLDKRMKNSKA